MQDYKSMCSSYNCATLAITQRDGFSLVCYINKTLKIRILDSKSQQKIVAF